MSEIDSAVLIYQLARTSPHLLVMELSFQFRVFIYGVKLGIFWMRNSFSAWMIDWDLRTFQELIFYFNLFSLSLVPESAALCSIELALFGIEFSLVQLFTICLEKLDYFHSILISYWHIFHIHFLQVYLSPCVDNANHDVNKQLFPTNKCLFFATVFLCSSHLITYTSHYENVFIWT